MKKITTTTTRRQSRPHHSRPHHHVVVVATTTRNPGNKADPANTFNAVAPTLSRRSGAMNYKMRCTFINNSWPSTRLWRNNRHQNRHPILLLRLISPPTSICPDPCPCDRIICGPSFTWPCSGTICSPPFTPCKITFGNAICAGSGNKNSNHPSTTTSYHPTRDDATSTCPTFYFTPWTTLPWNMDNSSTPWPKWASHCPRFDETVEWNITIPVRTWRTCHGVVVVATTRTSHGPDCTPWTRNAPSASSNACGTKFAFVFTRTRIERPWRPNCSFPCWDRMACRCCSIGVVTFIGIWTNRSVTWNKRVKIRICFESECAC
mmetsp:Transcript_12008/g.29161  ORF Transcript_12008/g.29161 Transcript_12008/m.29161 type:complete len:320 (+) Transcript_12008:432-1391(+)